MIKGTLCLLIIIGSLFVIALTKKMRLERVEILYNDPTMTTNVTSFTSRAKRGGTYKTNITVTILHPWHNNVSMILYYKRARSNVEHQLFRARNCDLLKVNWVTSLMSRYSDIPICCPYPANTYHVVNLELLPKNFPLPLPDGENRFGLKFVKTSNDKDIFDVQGTIHVM